MWTADQVRSGLASDLSPLSVSQVAGDLYKEAGLEAFLPSLSGTEAISLSASQDSLQSSGGARRLQCSRDRRDQRESEAGRGESEGGPGRGGGDPEGAGVSRLLPALPPAQDLAVQ